MRLIDEEDFQKIIENRISIFVKKQIESSSEEAGLAAGILIGVKELLKVQPAIEAKPVVHAHWDEVSGGRTICTNCGNYPLYDYFGRLKLSDICPHCGAQMDEVTK